MPDTNRNPLKRFIADRSGNFTMMFAAVTVTVLLSAGIALDFSRAVSSQSSARDTLDAAILATARQLSLGNITPDDAHDYLVTYIEGTLKVEIGAGREYRLANFQVDPVRKRITADLIREMPLSLLAVAGVRSREVSATSAALYGFDETEIVMTFDVTGSMSGSKIGDLKRAALSGVSELLGGDTGNDGALRIGIVPYAEGVNAGPLHSAVFAETKETSGTPPAEGDPLADAIASDKCATERKGPGQFKDDGPRIGKVNRDFRLENCPATALVPLTSNKGTLDTAINEMTVGGGTGGHIGIQWAWYLISPKWADYVPVNSKASAYGGDVRKFAIIMTDGEFNVAYEGVPKNQSQYNQSAKSMAKARKLCANMKKQGIEIFTIGFALNLKSAKDMLRDCASPDTEEVTYYFEASRGSELKQVYQDIATSIKQLRLVR